MNTTHASPQPELLDDDRVSPNLAAMPAPKARRQRRNSGQLRRTLLEVARERFDENGFQATTTAEISRQAGISERVLFNHFPSKAALFNAAVIEPFLELLTDYVNEWVEDRTPETPEQRLRRLVDGLYDLARQHRTALLTAITEHSNDENVLIDQLAQALQRLQTITPPAQYRDQYQGLDMPALTANTVGMIFGVALLDDLLFPSNSRRPGRRRLTDEMHKLLLDGMRNRR